MPRALGLAAVLLVAASAAAQAQTPRVRLAAASDCQQNRNCAPGFRRVYHIDPSGSLVRLKVADTGIQALDDGLAQVAVAFSSNPQLSRPDILALRDDRHMISSDHIVPVVRMSGSVVTRALVADLAYFYRHAVRDSPRFALAGGVTGSGIADAEQGPGHARPARRR